MLKHPRKVSKEFNIGYSIVMLVSVACFIKNPHDWWLPLYVSLAYVLSLWVMGKRDNARKDKEWAKNLAKQLHEENKTRDIIHEIGEHYAEDNRAVARLKIFMLKHNYPMCKPQPMQLDCRCIGCQFHKETKCTNPAPAVTLNENGTFVCWTFIKQL